MNPVKILLVDDESDLLEVLKEIFEARGYRVTTACSGKEALVHLSEQSFDVVCTDFSMPQMNGLELLKAARAIDPYMAFVFWSGYWDQEIWDEILKFGNVSRLEKPFKRDQFKSIIENIGTRSAWRSS